jgi:hypothetical protein
MFGVLDLVNSMGTEDYRILEIELGILLVTMNCKERERDQTEFGDK